MRAEIIAIGTELLLGEIVDTDTPFLARQLSQLGIDLFHTSAVGDNRERLMEMLRQAWQRSQLILTTGGLGPTEDDITREAVATLLDEPLETDQELQQNLVTFFAQFGTDMPLSNVRQTSLIPSATAIPNLRGTAPGWWVEKDGRIIVALPGPPGELQPMWCQEVLPRLQPRSDGVILSRTLKTFGLPEARIGEMITHLVTSPNPSLAPYAKIDGIYLRLTSKARQPSRAEAMIARREAEVRSILSRYIWGADDDTLPGVVGQLLAARDQSVAVAESFTAGALASILANDPGSQTCFRGGLIATSAESKLALGLDSRLLATSNRRQIAVAMASLARKQLGAGIGISIEGDFAANSDLKGRIVIVLDHDLGQPAVVKEYSGSNYQMQRRAAYYALFELRRLLISDDSN